MRCHKCGYVSFDYLSECKKCGVDVSGTRDKLGLAPVKPSEPFFLGALLKSDQHGTGMGFAAAPGGEGVETELADIELGQDASFELDFEALGDLEASPAEAFPGQAQVRGHLDSARKVMEEMETERYTTPPGGAGDDMELDLDSILEAADAVTVKDRKKAGPKVAEAVSGDTEIALSMDDLDDLMQESKPAKTAGGHPRPAGVVTPSEADGELELLLEDEPSQQADEEMVIELSSEDLEGLLLDLDETPGDEKKNKGKS